VNFIQIKTKFFKGKSGKLEQNLILEYLIVFQKSGLPIFSKCFGEFCGVLLVDESLLSGFLSAMTTMPTMFGKENNNLNSVEMGYTKLLFSHTMPSGHVICLGFNKNTINEKNQEKINNLFDKINDFIEKDYMNMKWDFTSTEEISPIVEKLLKFIIDPWIHISSNYSKEHIPKCPICIEGEIFRGEGDIGIKQPIWKRLSEIYARGRQLFKDDIPNQKKMFMEKGLID
jgi:hypothetical protein